jgi:hypothetical protein
MKALVFDDVGVKASAETCKISVDDVGLNGIECRLVEGEFKVKVAANTNEVKISTTNKLR